VAEETVLQEAERLLSSDREESYGPAPADAARFAAIAAAATGLDIRPEHYPVLMICVKLARQGHAHKRDNLVDIAGYASIAQEVHEAQPRRSPA
jgi:hypothetical protein